LTKSPGQSTITPAIGREEAPPVPDAGESGELTGIVLAFNAVREVGDLVESRCLPNRELARQWQLLTPAGVLLVARELFAKSGSVRSLTRLRPAGRAVAVDVLVFAKSEVVEGDEEVDWVTGILPEGVEARDLMRGALRYAHPVHPTKDALGEFAVEVSDALYDAGVVPDSI
jgi:hypothetical protein